MQSSPITSERGRKLSIRRRHGDSTASRIFDRNFLHPFSVDNAHLRMKAGSHHLPITYMGSQAEMQSIIHEQVHVQGTIWEMVQYWNEGASIHIPNPQVARTVYQDILRHLKAHLHAMDTNLRYQPPEDDSLTDMGEFAAAIYYRALQSGGGDLDTVTSINAGTITQGNATRAWITVPDMEPRVKKDVEAPTPKVLTTLDSIEEFLQNYRR